MRLVCECGYVARGGADSLVAQAREHARSVHGIKLEPEVILSLASEDEPEISQPTSADRSGS